MAEFELSRASEDRWSFFLTSYTVSLSNLDCSSIEGASITNLPFFGRLGFINMLGPSGAFFYEEVITLGLILGV